MPGGYNSACATAIQTFQAALIKHKQGWLALIQAERAYGSPKPKDLALAAQIPKLVKVVDALSAKFNVDVMALTSKCYTAADLAKAAAKGAKPATG